LDTCELFNRSGAAITRGQLLAFNLDRADVSGQAMAGLDPGDQSDSATGYIYGAGIKMTTSNARYRLAVALEDVADNATGRFCLKGVCKVSVAAKTPAPAVGDFIAGTNASYDATAIVKDATAGNGADALALPTGICGNILAGTGSTSVVALMTVDFNGFVRDGLVGGGG
jgi:hypothetical protein